MTARTTMATATPAFDVQAIRGDFPILHRQVHGKRLAYLDSAASAQKPQAVIDAITSAYTNTYANVHRGAYFFSETSTSLYEQAREKVARFINAADPSEIVFTKGATEAINLVAASYGRGILKAGDEVVITELEHHSNIVPWQIVRDAMGLVLKVVPMTPQGEIRIEDVKATLSDKTKLVAIAHVSNALGTVLDVAEITRLAHAAGAVVLIDGCQGVVHEMVDVQAIDCDFYAFSGHKLYGPTGIGVLYAKAAHLDAMPPYQGGGDMIEEVTLERSTWAEAPAKFEAGTPPIVQAIGLGAAVDYLCALDRDGLIAHERDLLEYGTQALNAVPGLTITGTAPHKSAVLAFTVDWAHPHDLATILDRSGVCVRAGHHCAQPVMDRLGVGATARASIGVYTVREDIDQLVAALHKARELFA